MISELRDADGCVLRVGHTADFEQGELGAARRLLELVFEDELTEQDWEHGLGGVHVMAFRAATLVGHAALIQRRLLYRGQALRTGYVEVVGVHPSHRRIGVGGRMMDVLEGMIARAFELGALGASDVGAAFYCQRGWRAWQGELAALTPDGVRPTPEEAGAIYVLEAARKLDSSEPLCADWRDGDVW